MPAMNGTDSIIAGGPEKVHLMKSRVMTVDGFCTVTIIKATAITTARKRKNCIPHLLPEIIIDTLMKIKEGLIMN